MSRNDAHFAAPINPTFQREEWIARMLSADFKKAPVLVLAPHPDDELGCAATIARLVEEGNEVHHYFFSLCAQSMESIGLTTDQLLRECNECRRILGIRPEHCGNFDYPVRHFSSGRQNILEDLTRLKKKLNPTLVLTPSSSDVHQDHHCIYEEAVRAFKHTTVLGYELPWNLLSMSHDCLIGCEQSHMEKKLCAVEAYRSQMHRNYANRKFFENLAGVRGVQANREYAECFEIIRIVL